MTEAYDGRQVVGMDLHRQRSVLVRMTADGRRLESHGNPEGMTAARRPPDTRLHRGARTQPHTAYSPPPGYR